MKKVLRLVVVVGMLACLTVPGMAAARGTVTCTGSFGAGPLPDQFTAGTIDANIDVPAGSTCSLYLQTVTGNVTVEGTLSGYGNTFEKNVTGSGSHAVIFFPECFSALCGGSPPNHVKGNFTYRGDAASNEEIVEIAAATIDGNTVVDGSYFFETFQASYGGNLVVSNVPDEPIIFDIGYADVPGIGGNLILTNNGQGTNGTQPVIVNVSVAGNLVCEGNNPSPFLSNVQASAFHGQCDLVT